LKTPHRGIRPLITNREMKNSIEKNVEPVVFQKYYKVSTENYIPTIARQIGSNNIVEEIFSSNYRSLYIDYDDMAPISHHIDFMLEREGRRLSFTTEYSFGAAANSNMCPRVQNSDSYFIFFTASNKRIPSNTDYHIFISEGTYDRNAEILERLRTGKLRDEIRALVGNDEELFEAMDSAISYEVNCRASRIVDNMYAIGISSEKTGICRPELKTNWGSHPVLQNLLNSKSVLATYNETSNPNVYGLSISNKEEPQLTLDFSIADSFGVGIASGKLNGVSYKNDCFLVFHDFVRNNLYVIVSYGKAESRNILVDRFRSGDLQQEFDYAFQGQLDFSISKCEEWLASSMGWIKTGDDESIETI
jgi:hypothetical protein